MKLDAGLPTSQITADQVRYWSDFNRVFYHPRSIVQLNEYELNSQLMPFESYDVGQDLFSSLNKDSDLLDRDVRPFVEECSQLDALQIFTSLDDAWGGFSSLFAESLQDEYGKTAVWLWGQEDGARVSRVSLLWPAIYSCSRLLANRDSTQDKCGPVYRVTCATSLCSHQTLQPTWHDSEQCACRCSFGVVQIGVAMFSCGINDVA